MPESASPSFFDLTVNIGFVLSLIGGLVWTILFVQKRETALRVSLGLPVFPVLAGYGAVGCCLVIEQAAAGTSSSLVGLRSLAGGALVAFWGYQLVRRAGIPGKTLPFASPWIGAAGFVVIAFGTILPAPISQIVISVGVLEVIAGALLFRRGDTLDRPLILPWLAGGVAGIPIFLGLPSIGGVIQTVAELSILAMPFMIRGEAAERAKVVALESMSKKAKSKKWRANLVQVRTPEKVRLIDEEEETIEFATSETEPDPEPAMASDQNPNGILATEPGRRRDIKIDPWTGAAMEEKPPAEDEDDGLGGRYRLSDD